VAAGANFSPGKAMMVPIFLKKWLTTIEKPRVFFYNTSFQRCNMKRYCFLIGLISIFDGLAPGRKDGGIDEKGHF
jgi:hypothetical protein